MPNFGGCRCRDHWRELVGEPTAEQLADPWFGFDAHNRVRRELGQQPFSEWAAQNLYGWAPRKQA